MIIPSQLKIGAHLFTVRLSEDMDDPGDIDESKCLIRLRAGDAPSQQEATLFHEILGACNPTMHSDAHALMTSLAEQLYQVLADNDMLK